MHWLVKAKSWQVFLFLLLPFWLQLILEFIENFTDNVPNMSPMAFSLLNFGVALIWVREIGSAYISIAPPRHGILKLIFSPLCWFSATGFFYLGASSILANDPEIFLQPSYLRPLFFASLLIAAGCIIVTVARLQQAKAPESVSVLNTFSLSITFAISLLGVWFIQPIISKHLQQGGAENS